MLDLFHETGLATEAGALTLVDVRAFSELVQPLTPWEATTLVAMSVAYVSGYRLGLDPKSAAPWLSTATLNRMALEKKMAGVFDSLLARAKPED